MDVSMNTDEELGTMYAVSIPVKRVKVEYDAENDAYMVGAQWDPASITTIICGKKTKATRAQRRQSTDRTRVETSRRARRDHRTDVSLHTSAHALRVHAEVFLSFYATRARPPVARRAHTRLARAARPSPPRCPISACAPTSTRRRGPGPSSAPVRADASGSPRWSFQRKWWRVCASGTPLDASRASTPPRARSANARVRTRRRRTHRRRRVRCARRRNLRVSSRRRSCEEGTGRDGARVRARRGAGSRRGRERDESETDGGARGE